MRKISFKFRQRWRDLLSFLRVRRFEGVITNASEEDIAKSSFKSPEEALEFLRKEFQWSGDTVSDGSILITKANLSKIHVGMIWYEDDTASFERVADKKIKAIVDLIEEGVVYGDLTASELYDIRQQELNWYQAERYFEQFAYPCKENENIVWYNVKQLKKVCETYEQVRKTFNKIGKKFRGSCFWGSTAYRANYAWIVIFGSGHRWGENKGISNSVRPVLALKVS